MRLLIISDTDSRIKWAKIIASYFQKKKIVNVSTEINKKNLDKVDVIILSLGGGANYKFLLEFHQYIDLVKPKKRPIIISGFNGITDSSNIHALLCRVGSDFICLNSKKDYEIFSKQLEKLQFSNKTLYLSGLAKKQNLVKSSEQEKIVFFAQPDVPKTKGERAYIVKKLQEIACKLPDKKVYIKPRSKKGTSGITHTELFFYQDILKEQNIQNVHLIYDDVEKLYETTCLAITVGSTVAIETIHYGIDTVVLSDFGVRQEYGNHHFMDSGCLLSFNDILEGCIPQVNKKWKEEYVLINDHYFKELVRMITEKIEVQKEKQQMLPLVPLFYTPKNASYFYQNSVRINSTRNTYASRLMALLKSIMSPQKK